MAHSTGIIYILEIAGKTIYISRNTYHLARCIGEKDIYFVYMGSCRAIYSYIAASILDLVRPRLSASDEPNPRCPGYIAVCSPPKPHIYIT